MYYSSDFDKSVQSSMVNASSVGELLDTMDVSLPYRLSVLDSDLWDKVMLVRPQPVPLEDLRREGQIDLEEIVPEVIKLFESDDIMTLRDRLLSEATSPILRNIQLDKLDPQLLNEWFRLTRLAGSSTLEQVMEEEVRLADK